MWAPYTETFRAEDNVAYDSGELVIHTTLATWQHSSGDSRNGQIIERPFADQFGNEIIYRICRFEFDRLELIGDLKVQIKEPTLGIVDFW